MQEIRVWSVVDYDRFLHALDLVLKTAGFYSHRNMGLKTREEITGSSMEGSEVTNRYDRCPIQQIGQLEP